MTISLQRTPTNTRNPGVYAEFQGRTNTARPNQAALLIGQKTAVGTATPGQAVLLVSKEQAKKLCGPGSMLANMAVRYIDRDPGNDAPTWLLPLTDDPASTLASGSIAFTGTAAAAGTLPLYVAGFRVPVGVPLGMTGGQLAVAVAIACAQTTDLPCQVSVGAGGVVTFTAKNAGIDAGDIDLRLAYRGAPGGEAIPAGVTATITAFTGGTQNPVDALTSALDGLGGRLYDFIANPYTDTASLDAVKTFLDETTGRWAPINLLFGHAWSAMRTPDAGGVPDLTTLIGFLTARNDAHTTILPFYNAPEPAYIWAADLMGSCAVSVRNDPGVPLQYLPMGVLAPPAGGEFDFSERNTLEYSGGATFTVENDGTVFTSRLVTTYQFNPEGAADDSWLDTETPYQLADVARILIRDLKTTFARMKLLPDGTRIPGGQAATTPAIVKAHVVARYRALQDENAKVSGADQFAKDIVAEIAQTGQLRLLLPITLADQLRQIMALITFAK